MSEEIEQPGYRVTKIVLKLEPEGAAIGIEAEGCDPYIVWVPGESMVGALERLAGVIADAQRHWTTVQLRYPSYQSPTTTAPPVTRTTRTRRNTTPERESADQQSTMF